MEQSWAQVIRSETGKSSSLPIQDANSDISTIHLSLPPYHVMNDTQVVKNIQELRRYIQEDCDQLKAGLKASSPFLMNNQSCLISNCDGEVKQCGYEEFEDATNNTFCDTSTQAPPAVDVGGGSVSSLYTAFKVMATIFN